ncbi:peptidoglycan recognition protein [Streptomyces sp. NPDC088400]|uniref:peptidoglycan recognition protein family protein n=1 Tax=Streptomyces sp. NPDC088400 TaxID=3365861 RepID=UPI00381CB4C7
MRAYLATSIGVACTAALVLPLSIPPGAVAAPQAATSRSTAPQTTAVPGSTQSLPLSDLASRRSPGAAPERGLARRGVSPFSLLGVVWDDADAELHGSVQVRTRELGTHDWSDWQRLETHSQEHGADLGTKERDSGTVRGATDPLWVGGSDGVEIRVRATERLDESGPSRSLLPQGLRLELVDPGKEPPVPTGTTAGSPAAGSPVAVPPAGGSPAGGSPAAGERVPAAAMTAEDAASSAVNAEFAELGATEITAQSKAETEADLAEAAESDQSAARRPYIGPRPRIITRRGWGADERLREKQFGYTKTVKAAFVHHSGTGNNYSCRQSPSVLRGIYRYHVKSSGWRDLGYNFAIDKCGNIYEGRAGGVARPVQGAHTLGFNKNSMGIAVLGTYSGSNPRAAATTAVARLTAWKLGLHGINPRGKVRLTSGGSNKYKKGARVRLNAISGHRDGFVTDCPGARLYRKLGTTRTSSARYQGR